MSRPARMIANPLSVWRSSPTMRYFLGAHFSPLPVHQFALADLEAAKSWITE